MQVSIILEQDNFYDKNKYARNNKEKFIELIM